MCTDDQKTSTSPTIQKLIPPSVHLIAAALGVAVAGPLGGILGGFLGTALGPSTAKALHESTEKLGEKLSETLLGDLSSFLIKKMSGPIPDLTFVYRNSLKLSLSQIRSLGGDDVEEYGDWFENWDECLRNEDIVALDDFTARPGNQIDFEKLFSHTLERMDAQGRALAAEGLILFDRPLPTILRDKIESSLPQKFDANFRDIVSMPENEVVWKKLDLEHKRVIEESLAEQKVGLKKVLEHIESLDINTSGQQIEIREMRMVVNRLEMLIQDLKRNDAAQGQSQVDAVLNSVGDFFSGLRQEALQWGDRAGQAMGDAYAALLGMTSDSAVAISDATINTIADIQKGLGWIPSDDTGR
jgi:hypothetical protein